MTSVGTINAQYPENVGGAVRPQKGGQAHPKKQE
jgi:hypothetical protein